MYRSFSLAMFQSLDRPCEVLVADESWNLIHLHVLVLLYLDMLKTLGLTRSSESVQLDGP